MKAFIKSLRCLITAVLQLMHKCQTFHIWHQSCCAETLLNICPCLGRLNVKNDCCDCPHTPPPTKFEERPCAGPTMSILCGDNGHLVPCRKALTLQHTLTPHPRHAYMCSYILGRMFVLQRNTEHNLFTLPACFLPASVNWPQKCLFSVSSLPIGCTSAISNISTLA